MTIASPVIALPCCNSAIKLAQNIRLEPRRFSIKISWPTGNYRNPRILLPPTWNLGRMVQFSLAQVLSLISIEWVKYYKKIVGKLTTFSALYGMKFNKNTSKKMPTYYAYLKINISKTNMNPKKYFFLYFEFENVQTNDCKIDINVPLLNKLYSSTSISKLKKSFV